MWVGKNILKLKDTSFANYQLCDLSELYIFIFNSPFINIRQKTYYIYLTDVMRMKWDIYVPL